MVSPYTKVIFTVYDYAGKSAFCRNNQGPMILKSWTAEMFQLKVLNYLWKIPRGYHKFSSWIPMALAMVFFSCIVKKASKTFQLESTVPKKKNPNFWEHPVMRRMNAHYALITEGAIQFFFSSLVNDGDHCTITVSKRWPVNSRPTILLQKLANSQATTGRDVRSFLSPRALRTLKNDHNTRERQSN